MKKFFSILAIACVAMLLTSCQKEGVFNPSKKISKIYTSSSITFGGTTTSTEKALSEVWTWNKNNTLAKIEKYDGNNIVGTETYTYDKKRIIRVDGTETSLYSNYTYRIEFKYNGKEMSEASFYDGDDLMTTLKFTHQNGKVTKIEAVESIDIINIDKSMRALRHLVPEQFYMSLEKTHEKNPSKYNAKGENDYTVTWEATWDKDNISKIVTTEKYGNFGIDVVTMEYKYDSNNNPYYGFLSGDMGELSGADCYSKNNITQMTTQYQLSDSDESDNGTETVNYTYTYTGKFPLTRSYTTTYPEVSQTYTTEYEYTK